MPNSRAVKLGCGPAEQVPLYGVGGAIQPFGTRMIDGFAVKPEEVQFCFCGLFRRSVRIGALVSNWAIMLAIRNVYAVFAQKRPARLEHSAIFHCRGRFKEWLCAE
jgi:23S rRNA C2498 (ribose-2'-O)-methylase RlmM